MKTIIKVRCPLCGFLNEIPIEVTGTFPGNKQIVYCELEAGGCDKEFIFQTEAFDVPVKTFTIQEV